MKWDVSIMEEQKITFQMAMGDGPATMKSGKMKAFIFYSMMVQLPKKENLEEANSMMKVVIMMSVGRQCALAYKDGRLQELLPQ